jgi:hypothetical protein
MFLFLHVCLVGFFKKIIFFNFFMFLNHFNMLMSKINLKIKNIILIYFQTINTLKNNYNYNTKYYHHYQVVRLHCLCFDFYKLYLNLNLKKE